MLDRKNLSVILHGQVRPETQNAIDSASVIFGDSELILVTASTDLNADTLIIPNNFRHLKYIESSDFIDYGYFARNFHRHINSVLFAINSVNSDYILKVRSDIVINDVLLKNITFLDNCNVSFLDCCTNVYPIYVFPYYQDRNFFNGDMVIYGKLKNLRLLFSSNLRNDFIGLSNTSMMVNKIPGKYLSYLSPEEVLYISYFKKILKESNFISFDDILGNINFKFKNNHIKKLDIDCTLPYRILKYHRSLKSFFLIKYMRNSLYCKIYFFIRNYVLYTFQSK